MASISAQDRTIIANIRKRGSGGSSTLVHDDGGITTHVDNTDPQNPVVDATAALAAANAYTDAAIAGLGVPTIRRIAALRAF